MIILTIDYYFVYVIFQIYDYTDHRQLFCACNRPRKDFDLHNSIKCKVVSNLPSTSIFMCPTTGGRGKGAWFPPHTYERKKANNGRIFCPTTLFCLNYLVTWITENGKFNLHAHVHLYKSMASSILARKTEFAEDKHFTIIDIYFIYT